ncbi:MAG: hypothetical protein HOV80_19960 [Polyangiaceae bacterium]|nr:hypothetical protein [Polyangiaceae bacterium]
MLRKVFVLAVSAAAAIAAACGGQVVFVEDGGEGGTGTTGTSTSKTTTKSTGGTTKATNNSVATQGVTTADSSVVTSVGSGLPCDTGEVTPVDSQQCGDCQGCVFEDLCAAQVSNCESNPECFEFNDCWGECGWDDPACKQQCAQQFPMGVGPLMALYDCVLCENCPFNCSGANRCGDI